MKKTLVCFTTAVMAMAMTVPAMAADVTAVPNKSSVAVDGKGLAIGAYTIDGYNYFKLRDVAAALNGTGANFEVGFDSAAKSIALSSKTAYSATGNELKDTAPTANKKATVSNQKIILDGVEVSMQAYLIDGYNYFQLRDLGKNLGFGVAWDGAAKAINMVTNGEVPVEKPVEKPAETPAAKTDVEKLQQMINASGGKVDLGGETFTGKVGDTVTIKKETVLQNGTLENITVIVDTTAKAAFDNVVFEGNGKAETALIIKNIGGRGSEVANSAFRNYKGDAIVIEAVEEKTILSIYANIFQEYGLAEKDLDAAIKVNLKEKTDATFRVENNIFNLSKNIEDETKMDLALMTAFDGSEEAEYEVYSKAKLMFVDNNIEKAGNILSVDIISAFADGNSFFEY